MSVRRRTGDEANRHIKNVCVRNGFYNVQDSSGRSHDRVERWFATEIESPVGPVFARLTTDAPGLLSSDDAEAAAAFVAAQLYRTATVRSFMDQIDHHIAPVLLIDTLRRKDGPDSVSVAALHDPRLLTSARRVIAESTVANDYRMSQLRTMLREIDHSIQRLRSFSWKVLRSDEPLLISGDAPAVGLQPGVGAFAGVLPTGSICR